MSATPGHVADAGVSRQIVWLLTILMHTVTVLMLSGCEQNASHPSPESATRPFAKRMIVLGFDGMDYDLTRRFMEQGLMPNLKRLAETGHFQSLATSIPPQSPVAWSNFITGLDSGGHGIFDFMHRDPLQLLPYLSTSRAIPASDGIDFGRYRIPLSSGSVELLRHGEAFWEVLEAHGVETSIIRMPTNFPPSGSATRELSGMGTPDILGTYGISSLYTSETLRYEGRPHHGGRIRPVQVVEGRVEGNLHGPDNPFLRESHGLRTAFTVDVDPELPAVLLTIGEQQRVIQVGEWSDWVPLGFSMAPTQRLQAQARFFVKSVRPEFALYVSPLNMDPEAPVMPISTPPTYARDLARDGGRFYTQGMPEDTNALESGILSREQFLQQAQLAGHELIRQYWQVLEDFDRGLLFYYFGNLDQVSHMMFRPLDPDHPAYDERSDALFADVIPSVYAELDGVVGATLERMPPDTTLVVMSDHGFTSIRREFHLNGWLRQQGYLAAIDPGLETDPGLLLNVDWTRTRAYGLGLNGLYLNLRGREQNGVVSAAQRKALLAEISRALLEIRDPATGLPVVTRTYERDHTYRDRGRLEIGPDLLVGYGPHMQCAQGSAIGKVGVKVLLSDNRDQWSGNHAMDHELVPGVLFSNHPLRRPVVSLQQLAGALLAEFDIAGFPRRQTSESQRVADN